MRSLFLENTELSVFDMTDANALRVKTYASVVRARVLHGTTPLELIERFTEYAGRMPPLPDWANEGAIVALARDLDRSVELVDRMDRRACSCQLARPLPRRPGTFTDHRRPRSGSFVGAR